MSFIVKAYVFTVFLYLIAAFPAFAEANRLALVIGNDGYENLPVLGKARNDAAAIANLLQELGYDVALVQDANRRMLSKSLSDLATKIDAASEVVFYFAGHGVEISGRNYLIPVDAPAAGPEDEAFLTAESFAVDQVLETIRERGARVTLLILDACRDNPFPKAATRSLGAERGLAPVVAPEGTFILFSAGAGQTALDGMGTGDSDPNSVFTRILLQRLGDPDLAIQDAARDIRRDVEALAGTINHKQRPAYYDELTDDYFIAAAGTPRGAKPIDAPPDNPDIALQDKLGTPPPDNAATADVSPTSDDDVVEDALADARKQIDGAQKDALDAVAAAKAAAEDAAKAAAGETAGDPTDDPFHMSVDDIPATLVDNPCFYAGNAMAQLPYPYEIETLLNFAEEYAACAPLAESAIDLAAALEQAPATPAPETWRVKQGVSEGHMNVRDGRGTDFPILFEIAAGQGGFEVKFCMPPENGAGKKDWCLIDYQGQRGWISSGGIERE
jgi:hypothetical protein